MLKSVALAMSGDTCLDYQKDWNEASHDTFTLCRTFKRRFLEVLLTYSVHNGLLFADMMRNVGEV